MKFRHSGDFGDCVASLGLITEGGPHSFFLVDRKCTKPMTPRANIIIPLIERQPYIKEVRCTEEHPDIDFSEFRAYHRGDIPLMEAQRQYANSRYKANIPPCGDKPWLHNINPSQESKDRVLFARSPRYNNQFFPHKEALEFYGDRAMFVGLKAEHEAFEQDFGPIEYRPTKDLLEVAELIAGSLLFIGNQSSPLAVAEGLKHPRIVEISLSVCDVIFKCPKAQWVADGACVLPGFGKEAKTIVPKLTTEMQPEDVNHQISPPGGWKWNDSKVPNYSLNALANIMKSKDRSLDMEKFKRDVIVYNMSLNPRYFRNVGKMAMLDLYKRAMANAGY